MGCEDEVERWIEELKCIVERWRRDGEGVGERGTECGD